MKLINILKETLLEFVPYEGPARDEIKLENTDEPGCSISYNENEEMMSIINKNGQYVFDGHYSDFNRSPIALKRLFESLGLRVKIDSNLTSTGFD